MKVTELWEMTVKKLIVNHGKTFPPIHNLEKVPIKDQMALGVALFTSLCQACELRDYAMIEEMAASHQALVPAVLWSDVEKGVAYFRDNQESFFQHLYVFIVLMKASLE